MKSLLLNGAIKPIGWTNGTTTPLDARHGAGVLNVFNSYQQLAAGKRTYIEATSHSFGSAHPPGSNTNTIPSMRGWDFNTIQNELINDKVHHYYFTLTNSPSGNYTFTATLVWNRHNGASSINNLNLYLYNRSNGVAVIASTSTNDNVEHIFIPSLPAGNYDLQVLKSADLARVSDDETYALSFEFFRTSLQMARSGQNVIVSWPLAPAGFTLESTSILGSSWSPAANPVILSNGFNLVTIDGSSGHQFFRLRRP